MTAKARIFLQRNGSSRQPVLNPQNRNGAVYVYPLDM